MTVDAHHHVWDPLARRHAWLDAPELAPLRRVFGADRLRPLARAAGVRATVVVQTVTEEWETPELLRLAAGDPLVAGVVGWTDLTRPDVAERLAELAAGPGGDRLVGIRHQVQLEPDPEWMLRPEVLRGLAAVADAGLAYDLVITPDQFPAATAAAAALPGLRFVLDHLGKPPVARGGTEPWAGRLREFARLPNTSGKLSGLVTEADRRHWTVDGLRPWADVALDSFGPERVMFGSDWPVCTLAAGYAEVVATAERLADRLTAAERAEVFAGTATRVYRLRAALGEG
ncbi:L-fuconolactonase [Streptomyces sp. TLI_053]|uniref:amidohydrolase family protein n=1 Tax=Streptomyces sp. TLI_053 TaxID=1855352 RepID=UPI00087C88FD|nr:amidohydrolase family protein [Streptomyces sp. TLI_053]SDT08460.1 L-fuconolactonase [Streptomyces sp. TLI_053]